ncbi:hypothetical protein [Szabonella alba]|uniref:Uncharacterized protein n=1 Tax=Szabonella alba TaxID=2804194 RepID=A0A8K0Y200_9RHOB|nr:hypothetical protein [Szabonella alba]MBL4918783.1 hypothetical protein [Szabonella alba]
MPGLEKNTPHSVVGANAAAIAARPFEKIFEKVDHQLSLTPQDQLCPKGLSLFLGELGPPSRVISDWALRHGTTLMVIGYQPLPMDWLQRYAPHLDFMMVDADYMDDTEGTVDFCMRVRHATPRLPLLLLSSEVRGHDLTCERMMACDVTLKSPMQELALTEGIRAAYQNNAYYLTARC